MSPLLEQTERLEQNRVVVTYKQMAELPGFIYRMTGINRSTSACFRNLHRQVIRGCSVAVDRI